MVVFADADIAKAMATTKKIPLLRVIVRSFAGGVHVSRERVRLYPATASNSNLHALMSGILAYKTAVRHCDLFYLA
jgi:hypothetical protein